MDDNVLWARRMDERRLLITTDKGFAQHRRERHHGILIVRLRQPNEAKIHNRVMRAIKQFSESNCRASSWLCVTPCKASVARRLETTTPAAAASTPKNSPTRKKCPANSTIVPFLGRVAESLALLA